MTYHDDIITITLVRGQLACSLGERGLMVKKWELFSHVLWRELMRETPSHDDGHTGSCAIGDLLIDRLRDGGRLGKDEGIVPKPDSGPNECWPFEAKWFNGGGA